MEEVSGQQFASMAEGWLKQTGFPTLTVEAAYNRRPQCDGPASPAGGGQPEKRWIFPISIALADASGNDITVVLHRVEKEEEDLELDSPEPPAFISINRGYSFYGKVRYNAPVTGTLPAGGTGQRHRQPVHRVHDDHGPGKTEDALRSVCPPGPGMHRSLVPALLRP